MPCKKCALNFDKNYCKKTKKLIIFKSLPLPFRYMFFNETWHICLVVLACY